MKIIKAFIYIIIFVSVGFSVHAQDLIYKKDKSTIKAKVLEVDLDVVRYKMEVNPEGPTYTIKKSMISKIVYKNGYEEVYNQIEEVPVSKETVQDKPKSPEVKPKEEVKKETKKNPDLEYGELTDPRDGQKYKTIKIGTQTWMAENMKYRVKKNKGITGSGEMTKYEFYKAKRRACPEGWHLPSNHEWKIMIDHLGGMKVAGGKLKSVTGWQEPNYAATNESGFTAIPTGAYQGGLVEPGWKLPEWAIFWTSTWTFGYSTINANARVYILKPETAVVTRKKLSRYDHYAPVRCMKNQ
ncbi:MAG: hypothetical protein C0594_06155 [Marinilabiliales bacterium]|nr:MAG: hypothetical protein C0594_06155 [Marinilabiliales bacterium]